jgi:Domain of unknown function (DUF4386)
MNMHPHTKRTPMDPMRRTAFVAGVLYLATFVFSIPAAFGFYDSVLHNHRFVLGAGGGVGGVLWGGLFEVITGLAGIGTAVVLYPVAKRYSRNGALGFFASRTLEASIIFVGVLSLLSVVTLRQDLAGSHPTGLVTVARSLVAVKDWSFLLGPGFLSAVNAICLGTVMYRSRLVPRIIPTIGLIGAPLLLASSVGTLFGLHDQVSATASLLALPVAAWEFSLGMWMMVKGFRTETSVEDTAVVTRTPEYSGAAA